MKKKLNEATVANELKGQSRFFEQQSDEPTSSSSHERANERTGEEATDDRNERENARASARTDEQTPIDTNEHADERTSERTGERTKTVTDKERKKVRYSFQFYEDQISAIQRLHAEALLRGERKDRSAYAREALDAYLDQLEERANE